jgi:hypothetical protein
VVNDILPEPVILLERLVTVSVILLPPCLLFPQSVSVLFFTSIVSMFISSPAMINRSPPDAIFAALLLKSTPALRLRLLFVFINPSLACSEKISFLILTTLTIDALAISLPAVTIASFRE